MTKDEKNPITFRELNKDDVYGLVNLLNGLSEKDKAIFHPHEFNKETLESNLNTADHYFVMVYENQIIGYSFLRLFGFEIPSFGCCIRNGSKNRGFGSKLIKLTIDQAKELGYKEIILKTYKENIYAKRIYERIGFKEEGETDDKKQIKMRLKFGKN